MYIQMNKMSEQLITQKIWDETISPTLESLNLDEDQTLELIVELMESLGKKQLNKLRTISTEIINEMEELGID